MEQETAKTPMEPRSTEPATSQIPTIHRPFLMLIITVVTAIVAGIALEFFSRRLTTADSIGFDNWFVFDPEVGFVYLPNHEYPGFKWFGEWVDMKMYTNSRGLKGKKEYPAPKSENELRVIAFGDSSTNGMHQKSYPEYLEDLLRQALPGKDIWVQNAGVNGYSSTNVKRLARREIPLFEPDVVIISAGTNDAGLADRHDSEDFAVRTFAESLARAGQYSRTVQWARRSLPDYLIHPYQNVALRPVTTPVETQVARVTLEERRKNLEAIISEAVSEDALPIITLYPWLFYNEEDHKFPPMKDYGPYIQIARDVAQEKDVPIADLITLFQRPDRAAYFVVVEDPANQETGMKIDNYHLNHAGTRLAAAAYARIIGEYVEREYGWNFDYGPIEEIEKEFGEPIGPDDGYLNMVPPEEVWKSVTPKMRGSNARTLQEQPEILGGAAKVSAWLESVATNESSAGNE